jgi:hypothetical protein
VWQIVGFVDRALAEQLLLRTRTVGAFLLRVSERAPGQFCVSYVVQPAPPNAQLVRVVLCAAVRRARVTRTHR